VNDLRQELDEIYKRIWIPYNPDGFRRLLEMFLPFSKWGFFLIDIRRWYVFTYHSKAKNVYFTITPDFEQYTGLGGLSFYYSRFPLPPLRSPEDKCYRFISNEDWFRLPFLENVPPQKARGVKLSVHQAFERRREKDKRLKILCAPTRLNVGEPAYSAAFEAFMWEYYGERFFRLFKPENHREREALREYAYAFYKAHYPSWVTEWETTHSDPLPPWEICL